MLICSFVIKAAAVVQNALMITFSTYDWTRRFCSIEEDYLLVLLTK